MRQDGVECEILELTGAGMELRLERQSWGLGWDLTERPYKQPHENNGAKKERRKGDCQTDIDGEATSRHC